MPHGKAHLADSLGGTGGRGDDVGASAAPAAPVLLGGPVYRLLRRRGGVHRPSSAPPSIAVILVHHLHSRPDRYGASVMVTPLTPKLSARPFLRPHMSCRTALLQGQ